MKVIQRIFFILSILILSSGSLFAQREKKLERAGIECLKGTRSEATKESDIKNRRTSVGYGFSSDLQYKLVIYYYDESITQRITFKRGISITEILEQDPEGYTIYVYSYDSGYNTPIEISKRHTPFRTNLLIDICKDYRINQLIFY